MHPLLRRHLAHARTILDWARAHLYPVGRANWEWFYVGQLVNDRALHSEPDSWDIWSCGLCGALVSGGDTHARRHLRWHGVDTDVIHRDPDPEEGIP